MLPYLSRVNINIKIIFEQRYFMRLTDLFVARDTRLHVESDARNYAGISLYNRIIIHSVESFDYDEQLFHYHLICLSQEFRKI